MASAEMSNWFIGNRFYKAVGNAGPFQADTLGDRVQTGIFRGVNWMRSKQKPKYLTPVDMVRAKNHLLFSTTALVLLVYCDCVPASTLLGGGVTLFSLLPSISVLLAPLREDVEENFLRHAKAAEERRREHQSRSNNAEQRRTQLRKYK